MSPFLDALLAAVTLLDLMLLGSTRLVAGIRLVAAQGLALSLLPLLARGDLKFRTLALAAGTALVKGVAFPLLLQRSIRRAGVRRESATGVGPTVSVLLGAAFVAAGAWLDAKLPVPAAIATGSGLVVPVAFATVLAGLFLIVSRRLAVSQVIGYLVLENGVYVFGVALVRDAPFLVELGVLLDVFAAVFIMGIAIFHISREFDHIDTARLAALRR